MGQPVVHFEVLGKNPDMLRGYYAELFGWEYDPTPSPHYHLVRRGGEDPGIGGGIGSGQEGYDGHVTFYVEVPDIEAALAKAEQLGGERCMGPVEVPGTDVVIGQFNDPEGHPIGVVKNGR